MPAPKMKLRYGEMVDFTAKCIALDWRTRRVEPDERGFIDTASLVAGITGKGVYVFQGRHDAHATGAVLYIGQAKRECSLPLRDRMTESFGLFHEDGYLFSDCTELTLHWAEIAAEEYIDEVERALITAHAPPFNSSLVRRWYVGRDLLILNGGAKGRLMPVVATAFHAKDCWPE
jgi:hypothetical protein